MPWLSVDRLQKSSGYCPIAEANSGCLRQTFCQRCIGGGGGQFSILAVSVFGCINFSEWHREQSSSMPQVLVWVSSTVTHPLCCTVGALLPQFLQDLPPAHPSTASLTNPCAAACLELQTYHAQGAWPWPLGTHHSPRGPHPEGLTE